MSNDRKGVLMKPNCDLSINLYDRVATRYVLGNFTETPTANQDSEDADCKMQAGVSLRRKPIP